MNTGTLSIVATPIGNMQDISLRAVKTILKTDIIACEDTRKAGLLLKHLEELVPSSYVPQTKPRLISYYDQVEQQKTPEIINLLLQGMNVTLISDAGTPLISDPGYRVVKEAIDSEIPVVSIPGPSAVITALTLSGLPTDKFFFIGYLPKKPGHRKELLHSLQQMTGQLKTTIIFFEAPHRLLGTLDELTEIFGEEKHIVVARELTKVYEEVQRGSLRNIQQHFEKKQPKGEFVLLFTTD